MDTEETVDLRDVCKYCTALMIAK